MLVLLTMLTTLGVPQWSAELGVKKAVVLHPMDASLPTELLWVKKKSSVRIRAPRAGTLVLKLYPLTRPGKQNPKRAYALVRGSGEKQRHRMEGKGSAAVKEFKRWRLADPITVRVRVPKANSTYNLIANRHCGLGFAWQGTMAQGEEESGEDSDVPPEPEIPGFDGAVARSDADIPIPDIPAIPGEDPGADGDDIPIPDIPAIPDEPEIPVPEIPAVAAVADAPPPFEVLGETQKNVLVDGEASPSPFYWMAPGSDLQIQTRQMGTYELEVFALYREQSTPNQASLAILLDDVLHRTHSLNFAREERYALVGEPGVQMARSTLVRVSNETGAMKIGLSLDEQADAGALLLIQKLDAIKQAEPSLDLAQRHDLRATPVAAAPKSPAQTAPVALQAPVPARPMAPIIPTLPAYLTVYGGLWVPSAHPTPGGVLQVEGVFPVGRLGFAFLGATGLGYARASLSAPAANNAGGIAALDSQLLSIPTLLGAQWGAALRPGMRIGVAAGGVFTVLRSRTQSGNLPAEVAVDQSPGAFGEVGGEFQTAAGTLSVKAQILAGRPVQNGPWQDLSDSGLRLLLGYRFLR